MPIYEHECKSCYVAQESIRPMNAEPPECPVCHEQMTRCVEAVARTSEGWAK